MGTTCRPLQHLRNCVVTMVCVFIQGKLNKTLRTGIYLFAIMNWISSVGYTMFPLSDSGNAGAVQDIIHIYVITALGRMDKCFR